MSGWPMMRWGSCIIKLEYGRNRNVSAEVVVCVKRGTDLARECEGSEWGIKCEWQQK